MHQHVKAKCHRLVRLLWPHVTPIGKQEQITIDIVFGLPKIVYTTSLHSGIMVYMAAPGHNTKGNSKLAEVLSKIRP